MVRFYGDVSKLPDPVLTQVLTLTDLGLACSYEAELSLDYPEPTVSPTREDSPSLLPPAPAICLSSPQFHSSSTFKDNMQTLGIELEAAMLLDDIRFLTLSITSSISSRKTIKIRSTASWLYDRVKSLPPLDPASELELITSAIRLTALIYTSCVVSLTPFTQVTHHVAEIKRHISRVPMSRWKGIPGIFLWILMVISPTCGPGIDDRKWRKKMPVTAMAIGLEGFGLGIEYLRANWLVQRWIAREREKKEEVL